MPIMGVCSKCGCETLDSNCAVCMWEKIEEMEEEIDELKSSLFDVDKELAMLHDAIALLPQSYQDDITDTLSKLSNPSTAS